MSAAVDQHDLARELRRLEGHRDLATLIDTESNPEALRRLSAEADEILSGQRVNGATKAAVGSGSRARLRASAIDLLAHEPKPVLCEPGCPHLPRGAFVNVAAPAKSGKSLVTLIGAIDGGLAGRRWVMLDRENGVDETARRCQEIAEARKLSAEQRATIRQNLSYHAWPRVPFDDDADAFDYLREFDGTVFDSSLRFQSALAGREHENESADYAAFVNTMIEPLRAAGRTVVVLDNMGHEERSRARGSSAKRDLCDVALTLEQVVAFNDRNCGRVRISVDVSRFGSHIGPWQAQLGGGYFGPIRPFEDRSEAREQFRSAAIEALREADGPLGQERLFEAVRERGVKGRTKALRDVLAELAADPTSGIVSTPKGYVLADSLPLVPIRDEGGTRGTDPPSPAGGSIDPADEGASRSGDAGGLGGTERIEMGLRVDRSAPTSDEVVWDFTS